MPGLNWNILICDTLHQRFLEDLTFQYHIDYRPGITYTEVCEIISKYEVLIIRTGISADRNLIERGDNLKIIARAGSGLDNIDVSFAEMNGIVCVNCPEANRDAVAEQAIGMLLSLTSNIVKSDREVRHHLWDREGNRGIEIGKKTVGIIGYGNTGSALARKLSGFGCKILAYDKYLSGFGSETVQECQMQSVFNEADILSFHIPLNEETEQMVNETYLNQFRKPFYLLNLSRGKIMVLNAILNAMDTGAILGFATDVLENENLRALTVDQRRDFDNLVERDNVIITPHIGGWSTESYEKISIILAKKIKVAHENLVKNGNVLLNE
jgi:D-3-phosphoglycerate dehydrogenase